MVRLHVPPGERCTEVQLFDVMLYTLEGLEVIDALETVTENDPVFLTITAWEALVPVCTFPKATGDGDIVTIDGVYATFGVNM